MRKMNALALGLSACLLLNPAFGAEVASLPLGTRVAFSIPNDLTSANLKGKQQVEAHTTEAVTLNGCEVIPKNATVWLQLGKIKKAGGAGRAGMLVITGAQVLGRNNVAYPLAFSYQARGKSHIGAAIPMIVIGSLLLPFFGAGAPILIAAFAMHGKEGTMSGSTVRYAVTTTLIPVACHFDS